MIAGSETNYAPARHLIAERIAIEAPFEAHPFGRILGPLPGICPRIGSRILAEIGDGSCFANGSRLASYARLARVTRQSGSSLRDEAGSRPGNHRLKNALFLAAFASLRDPASRAFHAHDASGICYARRPPRRHPGHAPLAHNTSGGCSARPARGGPMASTQPTSGAEEP